MTENEADSPAKQQAERRALKEQALRVLMTSEARQRLANIKMVKPEIAQLIEDQILQLASAGKLTKPINDEDLKRFLSSVQQPKKEFKIRWA
ncbi:MAG: DNA-binding protein [Thaumarchaeota archaeon]|nr:DNA-binding protein [Nitrososphaerota archaeon]